MTVGIADTNVLIELYRNDATAKSWFATQADIAITSISWLEFIEGARGKSGQARCLQIIAQFNMETLTASDQVWAMNQLLHHRLSHGTSLKDCLIASVCHRLQVPIYTKNVKDFSPLLAAKLVVKPY